MIARAAPAADTCEALLSTVHAESSEMRCAIYELDVERQVARLVSATNLPADVVPRLRELEVGPDAEAIGFAIHGNANVVTPDIESDPMWSDSGEFLVANGIRGAWTRGRGSSNRPIVRS